MFTVYSKPNCPHCLSAKNLLELAGEDYEVVDLDVGQPKIDGAKYISRDQLLQLIPSARTMPQIISNGALVGGYRELQHLLKAV